jgi:hypothetical protein
MTRNENNPTKATAVIYVRCLPELREAVRRAAAGTDQSLNDWCRDALMVAASHEFRCRLCGCTETDCRGCIERTGAPCYWVDVNLCSACAVPVPDEAAAISAPLGETTENESRRAAEIEKGPWGGD